MLFLKLCDSCCLLKFICLGPVFFFPGDGRRGELTIVGSPMGLTHICLIFHREGSSFIRNWQTVFDISGATSDTK